MIDCLTRPENCAERRERRRILALLVVDPCAHCTQRIEGLGMTGCTHTLTFPMCTKGLRPKFELDQSTFKGNEHVTG